MILSYWFVNSLPHSPDLTPLEKKALENIVGKGENAGNQHFLLFPQCFLLFPIYCETRNFRQTLIFFDFVGNAIYKFRVPRGSVVRCLTRNPGVLGSSRTRSSGFFRGSILGQDTSEPSLVLVKPRKT